MLKTLFLALPLLAAPPSLTPQGHAELSRFLSESVEKGAIPGAVVLVTSPDAILYHEAFGLMDAARHSPMRRDSIFRIASMTKALTSTAILMLAEEGKLNLDDDVARYLPAFKNPQVLTRFDLAAGTFETRPATRAITIRHLLTHTSGIGYSWSDPALAMIEKKTGRTSETDLPLLHEPGEKWTYGASTKVLGDVIEKLSGQPLAVFMERRLFAPLGMTDTAWSVPAAKLPRAVTLHIKANGAFTETPNPATLEGPPRGDGRLYSTANDYARFLQLILNRGQLGSTRLLQPASVEAMGRPQTNGVKVRLQPVANPAYSKPYPTGAGEDIWGLGFQLAQPAHPDKNSRRPGSMTWAGIDNTFFWIDPQARLGVIVLLQFLPFYDEAALSVLRGVETRVYQHLH